MSVDCFNESGESFGTGNRSWYMILSLAKMYGWEPAGTLRPPGWDNDPRLKDRPWNGDYSTNDGQVVTAEDALNLAGALERALPHIHDPEPPAPDIDPAELEAMVDELAREILGDSVPVEEMPEAARSLVRDLVLTHLAEQVGVQSPAAIGITPIFEEKILELIAFCRQGLFWIR